MRFYTKEWYELMQHQDDLSGIQKIPNRSYSDQDIKAFYQQDLEAEMAQELERYNTPPFGTGRKSCWPRSAFLPQTFSLRRRGPGSCSIPKLRK